MIPLKHFFYQEKFLVMLFTLILAVLGRYFFLDAHATDWRCAYFFVTDAFYLFRVLVDMAKGANWLSPAVYDVGYGTPYYLLGFFVVKIREFLGFGLSLWEIDRAMRWVSFLSALSLPSLYFLLQRRLCLPKGFWLFACGVTFTIDEFFFYSIFPKPDVLQFLFLLPACYHIVSIRDEKSLGAEFYATFFCALSASIKFGGLFLFPWVLLTTFLNAIDENRKSVLHAIFKWFWQKALLHSALFFGVYLLLNPRWFIDFDNNWLYITLSQSSAWAGNSIWNSAWPRVGFGLGGFLWFSYFGFLGMAIHRWLKEKNAGKPIQFLRGEDCLSLFPLCFFFYLIFDIQSAYPLRYLFPLLGPLIVFAARFWQMLWASSKIRKIFKNRVTIFLLMVGVFMALGDANRWISGFKKMHEIANWRSSSRIQMGEYLKATYPKESKIAFYFYAWVPAYFENTYYFMAYNADLLELLHPDLVVLTEHPRNQDFFDAVGKYTVPFRLEKRMGEYVVFKRLMTP